MLGSGFHQMTQHYCMFSARWIAIIVRRASWKTILWFTCIVLVKIMVVLIPVVGYFGWVGLGWWVGWAPEINLFKSGLKTKDFKIGWLDNWIVSFLNMLHVDLLLTPLHQFSFEWRSVTLCDIATRPGDNTKMHWDRNPLSFKSPHAILNQT